MRWLAVDFGERRVGVAISDPDGRLALPHTTIQRRSDAQVADAIAVLCREDEVTRLVLGEPVRLDGTAGAAAERVRGFARRLERATGLPVQLVAETLTSREAEARLREQGVDPRRHPERVDQLAAQLLLEEALARAERDADRSAPAGQLRRQDDDDDGEKPA